ncbi:MAG: TolC family protein [Bdellovibrionota bacterium]|nr:TolC family protein [Bdellovibrionota bacterium]
MKLIGLYILLLSSSVNAMTWKEALSIALSRNEDILIRKENIKKATYTHKKAIGGHLPTLTGSSSYTQAETETATTTTTSYGATLGLDLYSGFKTYHTVEQAKILKQQSKTSLSQRKLILTNNLRESFARALYAQKYVKLSRKILKRKKENFDFFRLLYPNGLEPRWALTKSKAEWKEAKWEVEKAFTNKELALRNLYLHMGLEYPVGRSVTLKGNFELPPLIKYKELEKNNLPNHPDLLYQTQDILVKEKEISKKKADYQPTISLSSSYTISRTNSLDETKTWSSGVSLSWPLFSGLQTVYGVSEKKADLIVSRLNRLKKKRSLAHNLKKTYQDHKKAREQTTFTRANLQSARERALVVQKEYSAGLKTYLDWESSQNNWTRMEISHLQALQNTWVTYGLLQKAMGGFQ